MADLTISPDAIRDALKDFVAAYEPASASATEVGTRDDSAISRVTAKKIGEIKPLLESWVPCNDVIS